MFKTLWFSALLSVVSVHSQRTLLPPDLSECAKRTNHDRKNFGGKDHYYFFSWRHPTSSNLEVDWLDARNICRLHCMDAVSIETPEENAYVAQKLAEDRVRYIWTSGRKCNFPGCERPDLQPANVNGWFWSGSGARIGNTNDPKNGDWSPVGGSQERQPDNREFGENGNDEACLAVLNNFYDDGIKWHDVACYHQKPFMCEDSEELINFARANGGQVRGIDYDFNQFNNNV